MSAPLAARLRRLLALAAILLAGLGHLAPAALAAAKVSEIDLEDEVMCVQCGRPLSTSSGTAADDERQLITQWIEQGLTKDQIKARLVAEYGDRALVESKSPIAASAPWIAALIGAASIVALLRRRRQRDQPEPAGAGDGLASNGNGPAASTSTPQVSVADDARIDAELAELD